MTSKHLLPLAFRATINHSGHRCGPNNDASGRMVTTRHPHWCCTSFPCSELRPAQISEGKLWPCNSLNNRAWRGRWDAPSLSSAHVHRTEAERWTRVSLSDCPWLACYMPWVTVGNVKSTQQKPLAVNICRRVKLTTPQLEFLNS